MPTDFPPPVGMPPGMPMPVPGAPLHMMPGLYNPYQGQPPMGMYPPAYGQMMPQPVPQPMGGQMGYPQMYPDGSFAGIQQQQPYVTAGYAPGNPPPGGLDPEKDTDRRKVWGQYSYLDDIARFHGWVLHQLARVFHERNKALKVCVPSAAFAMFFVIVSLVMLVDVTAAEIDGKPQQCTVAYKLANPVRDTSQTAQRFQPTVVCNVPDKAVPGRTEERGITRFRNADDYEVGSEEEAMEYLDQFCINCQIDFYEFEDGSLQLDECEYVSPWRYILLILLLLSAFICCCIWTASGTFACCSPLITVTVQA
jgi:hypothetical protein